jgi:precorrin-2/cobalt-factor-2 C20-methyltransferase
MVMAGTLYGIGIGPGDPDLITVKGVQCLARCRHVVVPKASESAESTALRIVRKYLNPAAGIHEAVFPMTTRQERLAARWREAASFVASLLSHGEDVCFPTLGDPFLYSTYIYLVRALRKIQPEAHIVTIPGVTAFSAAAAVAEFAVGEGKQSVTIIPTADDPAALRDALKRRGTVVIMKIGKRLDAVLDALEEHGARESGVFAAHVGMGQEHVETDLHKLRGCAKETGYLSIILTQTGTGDVE